MVYHFCIHNIVHPCSYSHASCFCQSCQISLHKLLYICSVYIHHQLSCNRMIRKVLSGSACQPIPDVGKTIKCHCTVQYMLAWSCDIMIYCTQNQSDIIALISSQDCAELTYDQYGEPMSIWLMCVTMSITILILCESVLLTVCSTTVHVEQKPVLTFKITSCSV